MHRDNTEACGRLGLKLLCMQERTQNAEHVQQELTIAKQAASAAEEKSKVGCLLVHG